MNEGQAKGVPGSVPEGYGETHLFKFEPGEGPTFALEEFRSGSLLSAIQERREVAEGNRCPYCRTSFTGLPEGEWCCPTMAAEFSRLEVEFWGTEDQRQRRLIISGIHHWLKPEADTPHVVTG